MSSSHICQFDAMEVSLHNVLYHYDVMGGGGGKLPKKRHQMVKFMKSCIFCAFMSILNMKAQKHACFHVDFLFSVHPITSLTKVKGLLCVHGKSYLPHFQPSLEVEYKLVYPMSSQCTCIYNATNYHVYSALLSSHLHPS